MANSFTMLLIGRLFIGFTNGWTYTVMPMYLAEISSTSIRGSISVLTVLVQKIGVLFVYTVGQYLTISQVAWIAFAFAITFLLVFFWCPESPYYLLAAKKTSQANKSLMQLRGHSDTQLEFNEMQTLVKLNQLTRPTFRELISAQNQRSLLILLGLSTIAQLNGSNTVMSYAEMVFDHIGSNDFAAGYSTIILGVVQLAASVSASVFMDKFGRRRIMFISIISASACNCILTTYFMLQRFYDVSGWAWLAIANVLILNTVSVFGMITLPMVMLGEIFPKHLKGIAAIVLVMSTGLCAFMVMKLFQIVIDSLGYDVMFGMFTIICLVYTPFFWYMLPETKGKSFQVILDELHAKSLK